MRKTGDAQRQVAPDKNQVLYTPWIVFAKHSRLEFVPQFGSFVKPRRAQELCVDARTMNLRCAAQTGDATNVCRESRGQSTREFAV